MSGPKSCPECDGRGWVRYASEAVNGEMETAYRLCGCDAPKGTPTPEVCGFPHCGELVPKGESFCGPHWAEWDMHANYEAWGMAAEILEAFAQGMCRGVALEQLDEAMEGAITHARTAQSFYLEERDRIGRTA
jgi:hypothetical protein